MHDHQSLIYLVKSLESKIHHYCKRLPALGTVQDVAIGVFHVDDHFGHYLAKTAVGNTQETEWADARKLGKIPLCLGLVTRPTIQMILDAFKPPMGNVLRSMSKEIAIVGAGYGSVGVFGIDPEWQKNWVDS